MQEHLGRVRSNMVTLTSIMKSIDCLTNSSKKNFFKVNTLRGKASDTEEIKNQRISIDKSFGQVEKKKAVEQ